MHQISHSKRDPSETFTQGLNAKKNIPQKVMLKANWPSKFDVHWQRFLRRYFYYTQKLEVSHNQKSFDTDHHTPNVSTIFQGVVRSLQIRCSEILWAYYVSQYVDRWLVEVRIIPRHVCRDSQKYAKSCQLWMNIQRNWAPVTSPQTVLRVTQNRYGSD